MKVFNSLFLKSNLRNNFLNFKKSRFIEIIKSEVKIKKFISIHFDLYIEIHSLLII